MTEFDKAKQEFLDNYLEEKFPGELKELYGDIVGILKAGFEAGIRFVEDYEDIRRDN